MNSTYHQPHPAEPPAEKAASLIERLTFHSETSSFFVLRIKVRGHLDVDQNVSCL